MKDTKRGNKSGERKKMLHCRNCGRVQSMDNRECEGCGIDLTFYSDVIYIEDPTPSPWDEERRRREEERRRREEERRRREEERRRADEERRRAEEERRRAEEERRRAEEERRRAEEERRREEEEQRRRKKSGFLKGFLVAAAVLAVLTLLPLMFLASNSQTCGDGLKWHFDQDTATLTIRGTGTMDSFTFTEGSGREERNAELAEAPWMADYREDIQHVVMEPGAQNIGSCAFEGCVNLLDVEIPETVKTVGEFAFSNTALVNVTVPASTEKIERQAFERIPQLRNFMLAGPTPELEGHIFAEHDQRLVIVGNDDRAHAYAESYDIVYVPGSAVSESGDFGGASDNGGLQWKINLYDRTMTVSGSGPMENFNGKWMLGNEINRESMVEGWNFPYWTDYTLIIEEAVVEDGITTIGDSAFEQCYNMRKITLPNTLNYIGFQSFLSSGLLRIEVPEGVTKINEHAFNFCGDMTIAILPESLERLQWGTFNMCNKLFNLFIGENTEVAERMGADSMFSDGNNPNGRPEDLTVYGKLGCSAHAFAMAENFKFQETGLKANLQLSGPCGDKVNWRFVGDERTLYIEGTGNTWYYHISQQDIDDWAGDLQKRNQTREGVPEFLDYAKYIEHIVVKPGVKVLGHNLFSWHSEPKLSNLKTVDYGSVEVIQANLKETKLEYVEIPESVVGIDGGTLADNIHLKTVVIRGGRDWIGPNLLYCCDALQRVELHGQEKIDGLVDGWDIFNGTGDLPEWQLPSDLHLYVTHGSEGEEMAKKLNISYSYLD